jgi:hypothetical protein
MKLRPLFVTLAVGAAAIAACTVFDGLDGKVVGGDAGDASSDTGFDAGLNLQPGYLSLADGVAFCSNAFACPLLAESVEFSIDVPVDANHFSSCIDWVSGPLPANRVGHDDTAKYLTCSARATTCLQATGCQWYEVLSTSDTRCAGDAGAASCAEDGGAIYFCGSNPGVEHCTNGYYPTGYSCTKGADNSLYCASPTCKGDQCSGAYLQFCGVTNKIYNGWDCNVGGFTCGFDSAQGYNDCLTDGVSKRCSALSVTCSGTTATICDSVYESHYDCGNYGGTCDQTGFPRCKRPGETCTPLDPDIDVCSGNAISLCVGGQKTSFDCSSIGKTCVAGSNGQSSHCK